MAKPTTHINKVCIHCRHRCKQLDNMELDNCPKFDPIKGFTISNSGIIRAKKV